MKNFELPLHVIAHEGRSAVDEDLITQAHLIYTCLEREEYREEAPDLRVLEPHRFFAELGGLTFEERLEQVNVNHEVKRLPKCLDIPLAFASGGDVDRARWLVDEMIKQEILHEPISEHGEFLERADMKEEAFEQIAEAEAENRREGVMRSLRRGS
jgi:hypothetical protein